MSLILILLHYFLFLLVTILWFYVIFALVAVVGVYLTTFSNISLVEKIVGWFTPHFDWTERMLPETSKKWAPMIYWVGLFAILRIMEWVARKVPLITSF